jgi:hypothetical protein
MEKSSNFQSRNIFTEFKKYFKLWHILMVRLCKLLFYFKLNASEVSFWLIIHLPFLWMSSHVLKAQTFLQNEKA